MTDEDDGSEFWKWTIRAEFCSSFETSYSSITDMKFGVNLTGLISPILFLGKGEAYLETRFYNPLNIYFA